MSRTFWGADDVVIDVLLFLNPLELHRLAFVSWRFFQLIHINETVDTTVWFALCGKQNVVQRTAWLRACYARRLVEQRMRGMYGHRPRKWSGIRTELFYSYWRMKAYRGCQRAFCQQLLEANVLCGIRRHNRERICLIVGTCCSRDNELVCETTLHIGACCKSHQKALPYCCKRRYEHNNGYVLKCL